MDWINLLEDYVTAERAAGIRPESIRTRMSYLRRFAAQHQPEATMDQAVAWLANAAWSPATRKSARGAIVSFYTWARRTGRIPEDPTLDLPAVRVPRRLPRPASEEQLRHGLDADTPDVRLMVALAGQHGLRRSEIAQVRREDLSDRRLLVHGKGGKERPVPLLPAVRAEIEARPAGFLFPGRFGGHLHPATVQRWIRAASGSSPHPFRHRFATRAYAGTRDLRGVQEALGHASAETTQVYVALADDALEAVVRAAA